MPEQVWVNREEGFIEVLSFGEVTMDEVRTSLGEVDRLFHQCGFSRILADTRGQTEAPSMIGLFQFGESLPRGVTIAMIVAGHQPTVGKVDFLRLVAQNRGTQFRLFGDRDEAARWLTTMPERSPV